MSTRQTSGRSVGYDLRAEAWRRAGIDLETAERFRREHARLRPSARERRLQRAAEVLDPNERLRLLRGTARVYGLLHAAAPDRFIWAGFAAIAVNDGVRPAIELAAAAAEVTGRAARFSSTMHERLSRIARAAEDGVKCAFETNFAIFADLAWVHLAFAEGGIGRLRQLHREGELDATSLTGFEQIALGERLGGEAGELAVIRGNLILFRHEQYAVVTPIFAHYEHAIAFATRAGLVTIPNRRLAMHASALGRSSRWEDASSGQRGYGPFPTRWRWLVRNAWEPLVALDRRRRDHGCRVLETEVARAVAGKPEGGSAGGVSWATVHGAGLRLGRRLAALASDVGTSFALGT